ncbi:MAG: YlxR family protein [Deltaproteobacteria bacterium]
MTSIVRPYRGPLRTCTGCRAVEPQAALVRVAFAPGSEELVVGRGTGRGAYVHGRASCWAGAVRGGLARSFRRAIPPMQLRGLAAKLSSTDDNHGQTLAGQVSGEAVRTVARTSGAEAKD